MFIGRYYHKLEDKGRISLPKKFREIEKNWVITRGLDGGLFIFKKSDFTDKIEEIAQRTFTKKKNRANRIRIVSSVNTSRVESEDHNTDSMQNSIKYENSEEFDGGTLPSRRALKNRIKKIAIPTIVIENTGGWSNKLANSYIDNRERRKVIGVKTAKEAVTMSINLAKEKINKDSKIIEGNTR